MQFEDRPQLPTLSESEEEIAKLAEKAIAYLKRNNHLDMTDILGLSSFVKERHETDSQSSQHDDPAGDE